ncbi:MAG TPA: hypothetical protein VHM70_31435 [Polyangiaceae bacterium]|nr:hypothetical protein [Polyangiaceae bacterium]
MSAWGGYRGIRRIAGAVLVAATTQGCEQAETTGCPFEPVALATAAPIRVLTWWRISSTDGEPGKPPAGMGPGAATSVAASASVTPLLPMDPTAPVNEAPTGSAENGELSAAVNDEPVSPGENAEMRSAEFIADRVLECAIEPPGAGPLSVEWVNGSGSGTRFEKAEALEAGKRQACLAIAGNLRADEKIADVECDGMHEDKTSAPNGPYDVMLLNAGADVFRFVDCAQTDPRQQMLRELPAELLERVPKFLQPLVACPAPDAALQANAALQVNAATPSAAVPSAAPAAPALKARLFAVPVGLHRVNQLYVNRQRLAATGHTWPPANSPVTTIDQFLALLAELQNPPPGSAASACAHPFALAEGNWPLSLLLVENLMVSVGGAEVYQSFWGQLPQHVGLVTAGYLHSGDSAYLAKVDDGFVAFDKAVHYEERLMQYTSRLPKPLVAVGAPGQCDDSHPIFTVMGNWETPNLDEAVVDALPFPGTEDVYVYTADAFAMPARPAADEVHSEDVEALWFKVVTDPLVEERYSSLKGSLPVFNNGDPTADAAAFVGTPQSVPGLPAYVPTGTFNEFETRLSDLMNQDLGQTPNGVGRGDNTHAGFVDYVQQQYCDTTALCTCPRSDEDLPTKDGCIRLTSNTKCIPRACEPDAPVISDGWDPAPSTAPSPSSSAR